MKNHKKCKHKQAHRFHENGPLYCEDCDSYLEYKTTPKGLVLEVLNKK